MGGDGGVVATNRRYMRGAGTADHTGDYNASNKEGSAAAATYNAREAMTMCALTKSPLLTTTTATANSDKIVADPYGRLYHKEAAVLALLERKQQESAAVASGDGGDSKTSLGYHIRRLSDLYDVRFHTDGSSKSPTVVKCPITGKELTGGIPAILLVPGREGTPNVVSEGALKQLSRDELEEEYGPIRRQVRLAPPPTLLKSIQEEVQIEQDKEEQERKNAKRAKSNTGGGGKKKRKLVAESTAAAAAVAPPGRAMAKTGNGTNHGSIVGQHIQARVDSAIQNNAVLSSLFVNKSETSRKISDKEHRDNLFAR